MPSHVSSSLFGRLFARLRALELEPVFTAVLTASLLVHGGGALAVHLLRPAEDEGRAELAALRAVVDGLELRPAVLALPARPPPASAARLPSSASASTTTTSSSPPGPSPSARSRHMQNHGASTTSWGIAGVLRGGDAVGVVATVFGAGGVVLDDAVRGALSARVEHETAGAPAPSSEMRRAAPGADDIVGVVVDVDAPAPSAHALASSAPRPRTPRAVVEEEDLPGDEPLPPGVSRTLRRRAEAFRACYESALKSDPRLRGKLSLDTTIDGTGRVTAVRVVRDTLHDAALTECVTATVRRIRFERDADDGGGEVGFGHSLVFVPQG